MVFYLLLSVAEQWPRTYGPRARSKNGNNGCLHVLGTSQSILLSASILALRGLCLAAMVTMGGLSDNDECSSRTMEKAWLRRVLCPALTSSRRRTQRMLHSRIPKMPANGPFHHRRCLSWMPSRGHWCAAVVVDWWLVLSGPSEPVTVTRAALAVVGTLAPKRHTSDVEVFLFIYLVLESCCTNVLAGYPNATRRASSILNKY